MIKKIPINRRTSDIFVKAERYLQSREDVLFAYLFGSMASGKATALSDVDIAVYLSGNNLSTKRLEILGDLIDILKTDEIDLVILNTAPLPLKIRILRNKRILSERTPFVRHAYESATMRSYLDFAKLETRILKERFFGG